MMKAAKAMGILLQLLQEEADELEDGKIVWKILRC
jgi:hypothetical protein